MFVEQFITIRAIKCFSIKLTMNDVSIKSCILSIQVIFFTFILGEVSFSWELFLKTYQIN